ncbi:MAG: DUF2062 domain-containing protein, partial [Rickettsiales bacterium]|nr:DUF2062 domain-containing protein [Rickettsiales bacterium]
MFSFIRKGIRKIFRHVVRSFRDRDNRSPAYLGRSFSVGFFSGMWVGLGQSVIAIAIWLLIGRTRRFRFSVVIACLTTLLTNPLTTPFWFYLYYITGQVMLGKGSLPFAKFSEKLAPLLQTLDVESLLESLKLLARGIGWPILIGSGPWYFIMAAVGYWLGARIAIYLRRRQHAKKKRRIRRMIAFLKHKAGEIIHHHKDENENEEAQVQKRSEELT